MTYSLNYPVANPANIDPAIFRAQIVQTMALQYIKHMAGSDEEFTKEEAHDAAMASWGTEWPDDPAPRTIEAGIVVAHDDLAYWNEE